MSLINGATMLPTVWREGNVGTVLNSSVGV